MCLSLTKRECCHLQCTINMHRHTCTHTVTTAHKRTQHTQCTHTIHKIHTQTHTHTHRILSPEWRERPLAAPCLTEGMESCRLTVNRGCSSGRLGRHSAGNDNMEVTTCQTCSYTCVCVCVCECVGVGVDV